MTIKTPMFNWRGLIVTPLVALGALVGVLAFAAAPALAAGPEAPRTEPAVGVIATAATFEGVLSPESSGFPVEAGTYEFLYKESATGCEGGGRVPVSPGSYLGAEPERVSQAVTGLKPGITYTVCLRAETTGGETVGASVTFTTVPSPVTEVPNPIGASTATFNGELTPLNTTVATEYWFDYKAGILGEVCTGEGETTHESAGTGSGVFTVPGTPVTGLQPNHAYSVCLVSKNAFGEEVDPATPPVHFTTLPAPPSIESETSSGLTPEDATLEAVVNPNNEAATCVFEYATDEALIGHPGATTKPCPAALGEGGGGVGTSVALTGLKINTEYFYRVVATNTTGPEPGTIEPFKTEATIAPVLSAEATTSITTTSATLNAAIDPEGAQITSCTFEYGTSTEYDHSAPCEHPDAAEIGAGRTPVPVSGQLENLSANTEYHWRIVATNAAGPSASTDQTFIELLTATEPPAPPTALPAVVPPPLPPPGATFPQLSYPSIAQLDAKETQEDKTIPNPTGTGTKSPTRAEKLGKALKACHKDHNKGKRQKCETAARKHYGPLKKAK